MKTGLAGLRDGGDRHQNRAWPRAARGADKEVEVPDAEGRGDREMPSLLEALVSRRKLHEMAVGRPAHLPVPAGRLHDPREILNGLDRCARGEQPVVHDRHVRDRIEQPGLAGPSPREGRDLNLAPTQQAFDRVLILDSGSPGLSPRASQSLQTVILALQPLLKAVALRLAVVADALAGHVPRQPAALQSGRGLVAGDVVAKGPPFEMLHEIAQRYPRVRPPNLRAEGRATRPRLIFTREHRKLQRVGLLPPLRRDKTHVGQEHDRGSGSKNLPHSLVEVAEFVAARRRPADCQTLGFFRTQNNPEPNKLRLGSRQAGELTRVRGVA